MPPEYHKKQVGDKKYSVDDVYADRVSNVFSELFVDVKKNGRRCKLVHWSYLKTCQ